MRTKWPYFVLLAELLLFFRHVVFQPSDYVIPWDFRYYHFNLASFLTESLRSGRFPLWDPYSYCGMPFFANMQAQVFYPPTLLTALASNLLGSDHLMFLLTLELVLHIFFAGVVSFCLLRELGCGQLAALVGATAFQLGCYFASQTQHVGAIDGGVWLPLSILALVRLGRGWSPRWIAILGLSLAMPILAGFPSNIGVAFLCSLFMAMALIVSRLATWRLLISYAVASAGALALAAIQLLPTIQIAGMSVSRYRSDWRGVGIGVRLAALPSLIWPNWYHLLDLRGYNLPYNFTFLYLYCGVITLGFVAVAFTRPRNPYAVPFLIFTIASALLMHGDATPLGRVLLPYFLDLVHDSVYVEFMMVGFSLGLAMLAGLGAQRFAAKPLFLSVTLALVIADLTYMSSNRPMNTIRTSQEPGVTPKHFDGNVELLATIRRFVNASEPPARVETYADSMSWTLMAPTIRVPTANGNDPFALIRLMQVRRLFCGGTRWGRFYEATQLDSPILDLLNVRFLITRNALPDSPKYRLVATPPGHNLYENAAALPRFFLVRRTIASESGEQSVKLLSSRDYDPAQVAVVEGTAGQEHPEGNSSPVKVVSYGQNEVLLETISAQPRFLVTSEAEYPGWRAFIDGAETPIVRTNLAFRGLPLPAGHHRIEFRFRPSILWWSSIVSAMALVALVWALRRPRDTVERKYVNSHVCSTAQR